MKFKEFNQCIELTKSSQVFIYFLLDENEVVYVGKTTRGISRIYAHKNKHFNRIFVLPCYEQDLDKLENKYIVKYKPKYNKIPNRKEVYSIKQALLELNQLYLNDRKIKCTKKRLMRMMKELDRTAVVFNDISYILREDLLAIEDAIEEFLMGENNNEIFDIWF